MKNLKNLILVCALLPSGWMGISKAQMYCTPPQFKSGPYTGISLVKAGNINSSTNSNDGYRDYTSTAGVCAGNRGSTVNLTLECYYGPDMIGGFSGKVNVRVWIDWNGDYDFNDAGETAVAQELDCNGSTTSNPYTKGTYTISVPATAKTGLTRMRIYEDMLVEDGHEAPNPCGYNTGIGQHGEAEDYAFFVGHATGIQQTAQPLQVSLYPNPVTDRLYLQVSHASEPLEVVLFNLCGTELSRQKMNTTDTQTTIQVSELPAGIYLLQLFGSDARILHTIKWVKTEK